MKINRKGVKNISTTMNGMCDIAFLLFIFIMIISSVNIKKPAEFTFAQSHDVTESEFDVIIFIDENGKYFLDGREITYDSIAGEIKKCTVGYNSLSVAIAAEKESLYEDVQKVWGSLEAAGCKKIVLFLKKI